MESYEHGSDEAAEKGVEGVIGASIKR